jgi:predicted DNA-binding transcriptional regulator YafY
MTGAELARRLQVHPRTLRRYIVVLEDIGIPVTAERGRDGAYSLVAGFKLPPMMFTDDETLALSIGLQAARGLGLAEASVAVASAQAKLERVMPGGLRRRVRAIGETVALDLAHPIASLDNQALSALSEAAQSQTRVSLRYSAPPGEETERPFDPYGLAYRSGRWYVVGMCHLRGGLRTFRLDRVRAVRPLPLSFIRAPDFDALSHLVHSVATLPRRFAVEVILRTDLATARCELSPTVGLLEWTGNGVRLRGEVDDLDWFARELARLPFAFEVVRPATLRAALRSVARRLIRCSKVGGG